MQKILLPFMVIRHISLFATLLFMLSSCAIYRIDIQQGNGITQEMVDQLRVGMPAQKVQFILGSPLLQDVFNGNQRWDYYYSFQAGGQQREQRKVTLLFDKDERLTSINGDVVSRNNAPAAPTSTTESQSSEPIL